MYSCFLCYPGKASQARELLQRCLKSLDKRDHMETIMKFAAMEYKMGDPERGRTLFESIISNYPKRTDVWGIYIDQEVRTGNKDLTRDLYERLTSLKLSSKKMKHAFKRFLEFEKTEGNESTAQHVKDKARAFVLAKSDA